MIDGAVLFADASGFSTLASYLAKKEAQMVQLKKTASNLDAQKATGGTDTKSRQRARGIGHKLLSETIRSKPSHNRLLNRAAIARADTVDLVKGIGAEE